MERHRLIELAEDWDRIFGPVHHFDPTVLDHLVDVKVPQYVKLGSAYIDLQPHNGYAYKTLIHDMYRHQMEALAALGTADPDLDLEDYRVQAEGMARFGGEMLVAIPDMHVSLVLNHALHTPDYLNEKLKIGMTHCIPLAVFLSQFSDKVLIARRDAANEYLYQKDVTR